MAKETKHPLKPGQILVSAWGYEQTNIDFYMITRVTAKRYILKKLVRRLTDNGNMTGWATPGEVIEKEYQARRKGDYLIFKGRSACLWSGKPEACSWYA